MKRLRAEGLSRPPSYYWSGFPVFRCSKGKGCRFESVNNLDAVLDHETDQHPDPAPVVRESPILGPSGEALVVVETVSEEG